jgi:hypothetical protein
MRRSARSFAFAAAFTLASAALGAGACATGSPVQNATGGGGAGGGSSTSTGGDVACIPTNCHSDAECGACDQNRHSCDLTTHHCVACGPGNPSCPQGYACSAYGDCVPEGATCPVDAQGTPTVTCQTSADCVACDPQHQVCDELSQRCVACTDADASACQSTEHCVSNRCTPNCPSACATDNDCMFCGAPGHEAHACNAGLCAQCGPTYACKAGQICSPQGVCVDKCGQDGNGSCYDDADCSKCGGDNTQCHKPINGPGECGPQAAGCSDLGKGTVVLPSPFDQVTNLCSNDGDCAGVGISLNVGKLLRDITGYNEIHDANITYGMNVCAAVTVGVGGQNVSCGVCVPCRVDSDCQPIDVDQVAGDAFGPLGAVAAAVLLDQIFGDNDHKVHMYCQNVAGDYGVCAPCPGVFYDCSSGGSTSGTCAHDTCATGAALDVGCDACTQALCAADGYCCTTSWDAQCVAEVGQYCGMSCP